MQELETAGVLEVHSGDALAPEAAVPGGFGSIAVDIFSEGALLECMTQVCTSALHGTRFCACCCVVIGCLIGAGLHRRLGE